MNKHQQHPLYNQNSWRDFLDRNIAHFEKQFVFENTTDRIGFITEVVQIHSPDFHIECKCNGKDNDIKINLLEKEERVFNHKNHHDTIEEIEFLYYKYNESRYRH